MIAFGVLELVKYAMMIFVIVAIVDCALRKSDAFPAVDRQTKGAWLIFLALSLVFVWWSPIFLGLFGMVITVYYFVDVRAKVINITKGNNRYDNYR